MLSGGQKQRIAFARALARNPEILVLDEATSSLDNESEALIQRAIENLSGKMTIIIIAHRLSTVMNATKLIVLYNGRINEIGSPSELLKDKDSYFSTVYNNRNKINDKNSK
jgi:ABC-type multidrug transport system fused ATPase/permease subunit